MPNAGQSSIKIVAQRIRLPRRQCQQSGITDDVHDQDNYSRLQLNKQCSYRVYGDKELPELLLQVLVERHWVAYDETIHGKQGWNLCWGGTSSVTTIIDGRQPIYPWQYSNHVLGVGIVTRKDSLARQLRFMRLGYGSIYYFSPSAFILPNDYIRFAKEFGRLTTTKDKDNVWICKPTSQSCGRGIKIFRDLHRLSYSAATIVQAYVCNPLLVSGYKFDLRLYVCIISFHPLVIYAYHDGLARYATEPFDLHQLRNVFAHLTNSSVNKFSPAYDERKGAVGVGCKWTLSRLRRHLRNIAHLPDWLVWVRVMAIVVLTILCEAPRVSANSATNFNTFELYGFDIIVDDRLAPWLLEVNRHPSLDVDCDTDVLVKKQMIHDLLDLLDLENNVANHVHCYGPNMDNADTTIDVKTMKSNGWQNRFYGNSSPEKVGGFIRLFPVGKSTSRAGGGRTWRGPNQTRSVVHYIRRLINAAHEVDTTIRSRLIKDGIESIPDDEEYFNALQELIGNDSVSCWMPRF